MQDLFSASPLGDVFMPKSELDFSQFNFGPFLYLLALLLTIVLSFDGVGGPTTHQAAAPKKFKPLAS